MLETKWSQFLQTPYKLWCFWYSLYLFALTVAIALRPPTWESDYAPSFLVLLLELVIVIHFVSSCVFELRDLYFLRRHYFSNFLLFTVLVWVSNVSFAIALGYRLAHDKVLFFSLLSLSPFEWKPLTVFPATF